MGSAIVAGRFEVRDLLGSGAFGTVLEAMDLRLRRLVALKLVRHGAGGLDAGQIAVEAQASARLRHPNIVAVHDAGDGPDYSWIAMEIVIGESLSAILKRKGTLSVTEVSMVAMQLLAALEHAHGRGIVHRDVKPANILLEASRDSGLGEVRLTDFGIARIEVADMTVVSGMVGTPSWMAPEQVRGEGSDHRADLWSAAVVLYECLTGVRPFRGGMPGILGAILSAEPEKPSSLRRDLDPAWDAIMAKALRKSRVDRYQDAGDMASEIAFLA